LPDSPPKGRDSIAELLRELNSPVAKSSDYLDGHEVARQRAAMSQRVKRGNAGTQQRRGLGRVDRFRHPCQRFHRRDHVFLIAAVVADSANLRVCGVTKISASARKTGTVLPTVPAESFRHARVRFVDHAGHCSEIICPRVSALAAHIPVPDSCDRPTSSANESIFVRALYLL
jgi:hypothetical protein